MSKKTKRLKPLIQAFGLNEGEEFIDQLTPQEVGNLLNLVRLREDELLAHYDSIRGQAQGVVKTKIGLEIALNTINELASVRLQELVDIRKILWEKQEKNRKEKEERIFAMFQPKKMMASA